MSAKNPKSITGISEETKTRLETAKGNQTWEGFLTYLLERSEETTVKTELGETDINTILAGEETEFFQYSKDENVSTIKNKLGKTTFSTLELLQTASDITGLSVCEVVRQGVETHAQKLLTSALCNSSNRGSVGSADGRMKDAINTLFRDVLDGKIDTITTTKITQCSLTNPRTVKAFLHRQKLTGLFKNPLALNRKNTGNFQNWLTQEKYDVIVNSDVFSDDLKTALKPLVVTID